jgi:hypothetical protein
LPLSPVRTPLSASLDLPGLTPTRAGFATNPRTYNVSLVQLLYPWVTLHLASHPRLVVPARLPRVSCPSPPFPFLLSGNGNPSWPLKAGCCHLVSHQFRLSSSPQPYKRQARALPLLAPPPVSTLVSLPCSIASCASTYFLQNKAHSTSLCPMLVFACAQDAKWWVPSVMHYGHKMLRKLQNPPLNHVLMLITPLISKI